MGQGVRIKLFAKMLEASIVTPERFPDPRPSVIEIDRRKRIVSMLRALSDAELDAVMEGEYPKRIGEIAVSTGLSESECLNSLVGIGWKFTERIRFNGVDHSQES